MINRTENDDGVHYSIEFHAAVKNSNEDKGTTLNDIIALVGQIQTQMENTYTIDESEGQTENGKTLTTSISVHVRRLDKGEEAKDNEHVFDVTGELPADEGGKAWYGEKYMQLNGEHLSNMLFGTESNPQDLTTLSHEPGHAGGLAHPDERVEWHPRTWRRFGKRNQYLEPGEDDDNVMWSGGYYETVLGGHKNNNGKGFKVNGNQIRILYENRDKGDGR